ncbi:hypothetical protein BASA61_009480 [Batrachochytrium salamandrivorans]|nr:hypothetical protein BASA62_004931 [Batrachochytrium salamandrivorans]KAH6580669.1 hypothetical protein BASA61_009480 [Batrachochytrium salamandrivorans]KAJ1344332.1 hypothetical protein BSLG_001142 [Batrachochytrium salamandrivorans]
MNSGTLSIISMMTASFKYISSLDSSEDSSSSWLLQAYSERGDDETLYIEPLVPQHQQRNTNTPHNSLHDILVDI